VARRILLIEDNAILSYAFGLELRLEGHEVRVAANGEAGLAAAPEFRPEVVLLDLGLPDIDGYTVARRLRDGTIPGNPEPLITALTGHVQEQYRIASKDAGCDYHMVKPVDVDVLRTILRTPSAYRTFVPGADGRAVL
jgi:two-component system CheB/CheR fusion protein